VWKKLVLLNWPEKSSEPNWKAQSNMSNNWSSPLSLNPKKNCIHFLKPVLCVTRYYSQPILIIITVVTFIHTFSDYHTGGNHRHRRWNRWTAVQHDLVRNCWNWIVKHNFRWRKCTPPSAPTLIPSLIFILTPWIKKKLSFHAGECHALVCFHHLLCFFFPFSNYYSIESKLHSPPLKDAWITLPSPLMLIYTLPSPLIQNIL